MPHSQDMMHSSSVPPVFRPNAQPSILHPYPIVDAQRPFERRYPNLAFRASQCGSSCGPYVGRPPPFMLRKRPSHGHRGSPRFPPPNAVHQYRQYLYTQQHQQQPLQQPPVLPAQSHTTSSLLPSSSGGRLPPPPPNDVVAGSYRWASPSVPSSLYPVPSSGFPEIRYVYSPHDKFFSGPAEHPSTLNVSQQNAEEYRRLSRHVPSLESDHPGDVLPAPASHVDLDEVRGPSMLPTASSFPVDSPYSQTTESMCLPPVEVQHHSSTMIASTPATTVPEEGEVVVAPPLQLSASALNSITNTRAPEPMESLEDDQISVVSDTDEEDREDFHENLVQAAPCSSQDGDDDLERREKALPTDAGRAVEVEAPASCFPAECDTVSSVELAVHTDDGPLSFWKQKVQARAAPSMAMAGSRSSDSISSSNNDVIVFKLSNIDLSTDSPLLKTFAFEFLPFYREQLTKTAVTDSAKCSPRLAEVFLLQSQLTPASLHTLLKSFATYQFLPTALHLGSNPLLGPDGLKVLAEFIRQSREPLRWLALSKCNVTASSLQELLDTVLTRSDIYPRIHQGKPVPLWLDLSSSLDGSRDANGNGEASQDVFEYLNQIRDGLYCDAKNRVECGINRCGSPSAIFHIPKLGGASTARVASRTEPSEKLFPVAEHFGSPQSVFCADIAASSDAPPAYSAAVRHDGEMSEIDTEDEDEWPIDEICAPLKTSAPATDAPAMHPESLPEYFSQSFTSVGISPNEALENATRVLDTAAVDQLRLSSREQPDEPVDHNVTSFAYASLLRDAFLSLALIAADRQIFPIDFLRDLACVYLAGQNISEVPVPALWRILSPSLLSQHLLSISDGVSGLFSLPVNQRKRQRFVDASVQSNVTPFDDHPPTPRPKSAVEISAPDREIQRVQSFGGASGGETIDFQNLPASFMLDQDSREHCPLESGMTNHFHSGVSSASSSSEDEEAAAMSEPVTDKNPHVNDASRTEDDVACFEASQTQTSHPFHASEMESRKPVSAISCYAAPESGKSDDANAGAEEGEIQDNSFVPTGHFSKDRVLSPDNFRHPSPYVRRKALDPHTLRSTPLRPRRASGLRYSYAYEPTQKIRVRNQIG